jgi:prolyl 4-hydroxylase
MSKVKEITPQWSEWVSSNLTRGCTQESLIEAMLGGNFDPAFSVNFVQKMAVELHQKAAGLVQIPSNTHSHGVYMYEPSRLQNEGSIIETSDRRVEVLMRFNKPSAP